MFLDDTSVLQQVSLLHLFWAEPKKNKTTSNSFVTLKFNSIIVYNVLGMCMYVPLLSDLGRRLVQKCTILLQCYVIKVKELLRLLEMCMSSLML